MRPEPLATPRTLKQAAERLRAEARRIEWDGMGQSAVYNREQQRGLLYAASLLDEWRSDRSRKSGRVA